MRQAKTSYLSLKYATIDKMMCNHKRYDDVGCNENSFDSGRNSGFYGYHYYNNVFCVIMIQSQTKFINEIILPHHMYHFITCYLKCLVVEVSDSFFASLDDKPLTEIYSSSFVAKIKLLLLKHVC